MEKIKEIYKKYKEIINYLIFGFLTTVINFVSYYICARIFLIDEVISSIIAWFISVLFAYITNKLLVFDQHTDNIKSLIKEMVSFFLARIASGILFDVGTFAVMVKVLHINDIISKFITQVMTIITNYLLSKLVIFKTKNKM